MLRISVKKTIKYKADNVWGCKIFNSVFYGKFHPLIIVYFIQNSAIFKNNSYFLLQNSFTSCLNVFFRRSTDVTVCWVYA